MNIPDLFLSPAPGLIISPSLEPIPPRTVQRIQSGQFIEMKELLPDNMALQQQVEAMQ